MKRSIPLPGDLIQVAKSEWYALRDEGWLRVCEHPGWTKDGEELYVAPRFQVRTFWGPDFGPPDGVKPLRMSTSGGPFRTVRLTELEGLEPDEPAIDVFWCWQDRPRAAGGVERSVEVFIWKCRLLADAHYRRCREFQEGGEQ